MEKSELNSKETPILKAVNISKTSDLLEEQLNHNEEKDIDYSCNKESGSTSSEMKGSNENSICMGNGDAILKDSDESFTNGNRIKPELSKISSPAGEVNSKSNLGNSSSVIDIALPDVKKLFKRVSSSESIVFIFFLVKKFLFLIVENKFF